MDILWVFIKSRFFIKISLDELQFDNKVVMGCQMRILFNHKRMIKVWLDPIANINWEETWHSGLTFEVRRDGPLELRLSFEIFSCVSASINSIKFSTLTS